MYIPSINPGYPSTLYVSGSITVYKQQQHRLHLLHLHLKNGEKKQLCSVVYMVNNKVFADTGRQHFILGSWAHTADTHICKL